MYSTKKKKIYIVVGSAILIIISLVFLLIFKTNISSQHETIAYTSPVINPIVRFPTVTPTSSQTANPLNGMPIDNATYQLLLKNRPLAVMIPNSEDARPQSGLNRADVVYEALTEGPLTRFMAVFWSDQSDYKLMPIRSTRVYFLNWLLEYNDIILANTGYAETSDPKTNALAILQNYNVKTLVWDFAKVFKYDPPCVANPNIPGWDCATSTSQILWNYSDQTKNWTGDGWNLPSTQQWKFKDEAALTDRGNTINNITVNFLYKNDAWQANWVYDKSTNLYMREDYKKKPMLDAIDKTQLNTKTLIVQQVPFSMTHDTKNRSIQDNIGTGVAYVFEDGNVTVGTWKKTDITSRTRYYDSNNNEIQLNKGRIWVSQIPNNQPLIYGP